MDLLRKTRKSFIGSLTLLICIFNVVLIVLFISMSYYMVMGNVERNARSSVDSSLALSENAYEEFMSRNALTFDYLSGSDYVWEFFEGGTETVDVMGEINNILSASKEIDNIWVLCSNGKCVDKNGPCSFALSGLMDIPIRSEKTVLLGSYYSEETGIVFYKTVEDSGVPVGIIYASINKNPFCDFIYSSHNKDSYSFIFSDTDLLIGEQDGGRYVIINALGREPDDISSLFCGVNTGVPGSVGKVGSKCFYRSVRLSSGWILGMVYGGTSISGEFAKTFSQQVIVLVCLFVLELIATLNAIRYQARDIPEISGSIAQISQGNYNFRINSTSENELGVIARSVDALAQQLQDKNAVIEDYINVDATTGLYNRYKMYEYIQDLAEGRDDTRPRFVLLFIDIDNFKWVTETLGHKQGDEFLRIFGQRIKKVIPKVFRFSGDEFVVISELGKDMGQVRELVRSLKEQFAEPIEILNNKLYAHFSVGIAVYPDDDTNPDMLLRDADIAMQRAKERGKGHTEFFSTIFHKNIENKSSIAQHLNKAVENGELYLVYQPIISVKNGDIHGFEALVRWENPELGYVPPSDFVSIAEETGTIEKIGTWIFENGCRMLKKINEYNPNVVMSINVSAVQLKKGDFLSKIRRTISVFGIDPGNLQIEITESSFVDLIDNEGNADKLTKLAQMGISIALDDFGTGYSSFAYLKDMPVKTLKVDKSFVDEIGSKSKDYKIANSIIGMVRSIGIKTVVEGVESIEQYNILSKFGCDYIQGFLMSKPLSEKDAIDFVTEYEEFHKPNEQILTENSYRLEEEKKNRG
ncbi:MAG: EAL domain-containing protein [Oscillospiraceae bacterium]|nr:EAL domain-containing protein [Oscillospiraceae bacterium]